MPVGAGLIRRGGNRSSNDLFSGVRFRASKSSRNENRLFAPRAESVSPVKIAFIGTGATASSGSADAK